MDDCFETCSEQFSRMTPCKRCCLLSMCIGFVALLVYIAVAIEGVEPTEFAIIRNNINQSVDGDEVYGQGLHWVGLFYSLIHYPAIHKNIEFSDDWMAQQQALKTRTKEGLELHLHCAFQYQLKKTELPALYRMTQTDFEPFLIRLARNAVLRVAGDYEAPQYWKDREAIGQNMRQALIDDLQKAHTEVTGFMLLKIDLPDVYEDAIVQTEVTNQEIVTYGYQRSVSETQQGIENIKAKALADIMAINANASSNATAIKNTGAGTVAQQNINYTTKALKEVN